MVDANFKLLNIVVVFCPCCGGCFKLCRDHGADIYYSIYQFHLCVGWAELSPWVEHKISLLKLKSKSIAYDIQ